MHLHLQWKVNPVRLIEGQHPLRDISQFIDDCVSSRCHPANHAHHE